LDKENRVTVGLFLELMQILAAMGGAGVAFLTIEKDIRERQLEPSDPLPSEHEATVRAVLAPATVNPLGNPDAPE
jgi:hypothetical protein